MTVDFMLKQPCLFAGKHPVSALVELCNRRKWGPPDFQLQHESGPDHKKNFLFKVSIPWILFTFPKNNSIHQCIMYLEAL